MAAVLVAYLVVILAVFTTSPLVRLDWQVMLYRPYKHWPQLLPWLSVYVVLGQRAPTATAALAWLGWRSYRTHTTRPLLVALTALGLLNLTVGAVKVGLGRLGPHYATVLGSNELFRGGDIFPSGHTSNAVVTWGVLAYLATSYRRRAAYLAGALAATVGVTTLYLGTHWVSDVFAGWLAGTLVLLVLPMLEPAIHAADKRLLGTRLVRRLLGHRTRSPSGLPSLPPPRSATPPEVRRGSSLGR